ncbi:MAG: glycosyltransferase involved in cell wall biosynthesis [Vicingaceae bacterium]|jgi:glycosyltransferase involved in cell wall biosynthesis
MKLAILAQAYLLDPIITINGTLVQLYNLSHGFAKAGVEVHYIAATKNANKPQREVVNGIHFYWIYTKGGILDWHKDMKKYKTILEAVKPKAVYVRGRNVLQYVAGKYAEKHHINYVWGTNGDDSAELWKNVKRLKNTNKSLVKKIALWPLKAFEDSYINKGMKLTSTIINQSVHQQKETKRLLDKYGIVIPSFFLRAEHQFKKENTILWLANLSPGKQPDLFVRLMNECSQEGWNAILGGGTSDKNYEDEIRSSIEKDAISMKGQIEFEDSFEFYQSSKIYINTSQPEADGLPNAYIQSWLNGTVVLSLHHDPNRWMETYNIGFCSHGDFEALKVRLQQLINTPEELQVMSDNAIAFAKETFANQAILDEYVKLFEK